MGALAACVPSADQPVPTASATASSPRPTATPTPTPTPTPTASAGVIPYSAPCDQLLTPDTIYAFDPNFALLGSFDPAPGSLAAEVQAAGGTLCRWVHSTNSVTVDVAVAELSPEASAAKVAALNAAGLSVADFGPNGFFGVDGGTGQAQVLPSSYWVTLVSPVFGAPGDVAPLLSSLTASL